MERPTKCLHVYNPGKQGILLKAGPECHNLNDAEQLNILPHSKFFANFFSLSNIKLILPTLN